MNSKFLNRTTYKCNLHNNCRRITKLMFFRNMQLEYIYNTKNLYRIDDCAFDNTNNLKYIELNNSLVYIGKNAFENSSLQIIKIPPKVIEIQNETFMDCAQLRKVIFSKKSKLSKIKYAAFKNCSQLVELYLPKHLTYIDEFAFSGCTNLQKVFIPKTIKYIRQYAFNKCQKLKQVIFY